MVAAVTVALNVMVEVTVWSMESVTELGLNVIDRGGVAGIIDGAVRLTVPEKWFRLERVAVAVPVEPEVKEIEVGLTVKPKSSTTTWSTTTPTRVSGLPAASLVA